MQFATMLELRCGDRMRAAKRARARALRARGPVAAAARARWRLRGARELRRAGGRETLGGEWMLLHAFAWRRLLGATARDAPQRRLRLDAVPPPALDPQPGARVAGEPGAARAGARRSRRCGSPCATTRRARVNLLIPTIDLRHFFGGYIAQAQPRAAAGRARPRVRVVTVDPVGPLPRGVARELEAYGGLAGVFDRVEVAFGRESPRARGEPRRRVRRDDVVDGARRARRAARARARALPLPDPGVRAVHVPDGQLRGAGRRVLPAPARRAVLDRAAARLLPRAAGSASTRRRGAGDAGSAAFRNAITAVEPPPARASCARRRPRRLLFYARPEPHAARNMFELGALALGARARARRVRGRLDAARHRHRRAGARGSTWAAARARAAAARRPGRLRGAAARARRRAWR